MNEHFVIQLLHKHYTGELDAKDKDLLFDWLQESPENESYGESIKQIWEQSSNYAPKVDFESKTESAFQKFSANIRKDAVPDVETITPQLTTEGNQAITRKFPLAWILAVAACLILIAGTFWLLTQSETNTISNTYATISTISDQQEKLILQDNSIAWLNEKSTMKYFDDKSSAKREVVLDGEAFFEIEKSKAPFIITTENAQITVLGTIFNVDSDEEGTEVHVKSGKVELRPLNSNQVIELNKNQIGVYDAVNKKLYHKQSKSYNGDSWRTKGFSFEDAKLSEVFSTLEDYYNVSFELENEGLNTCVFTSPIYQNAEIDEVLSVMEVIYHFTYEKQGVEGKVIKINGGRCNM